MTSVDLDLVTVIDSPVALNNLTKRAGVQPDNWNINANKQPIRAIQRMRPNEKELSHRWRERALLRSLLLKSCENYSLRRPAVSWSDWLGVGRTGTILR